MSKDGALEKWLVSETGYRRTMRHSPRVADDAEAVAREAWHAAVKHTLEFVAGELNTRAEKQSSIGTVLVRQYLRKLAGIVLKMKP